MKKELDNWERLKGNKPFKTPEGYFEDFTSRMMSQLPEKKYEQPKKVTLMERVRPWLYMAAVFAGLGLFFKAIISLGDPSDALVERQAEVNEDYLEYVESQYASYILAEEMDIYE
ncbi:MAG: hypothetical protein LBK45_02440 [Tannerellaceae bacterium]|jgi:hypothetical protein|nr:hypothetical protein [Tannerellaceae bacterium]